MNRKCSLIAGTGHEGCPIPVEPAQQYEPKVWSQPADASSPCLRGHIMMLVYFIPLLEDFIKKHLQGFEVLGWTSCSVNVSSHSNTVLSGRAGTKTLTSDEDIKPKVYCSQPKLRSLQGEVTALLRRSRIYGDGAARSLSCSLMADVTHQVSG